MDKESNEFSFENTKNDESFQNELTCNIQNKHITQIDIDKVKNKIHE